MKHYGRSVLLKFVLDNIMIWSLYGVCLALHFVMLRGTELKLGIGVGGRDPSFESIFLK